jgi:hypothetical protein
LSYSDYSVWVQSMRVAIMGASIARQYHERISTGYQPDEKAMAEFSEVASKAADLWEAAVVNQEWKR